MKIRGLKIAEYVLWLLGLVYVIRGVIIFLTSEDWGAMIASIWLIIGIIFLACGFIIRQGSKNKSN